MGNPPFGSCEDPAAIRRYAKSLEEAKKTRPYFADLFVERSLNLLDEGGIVQFVLPEAILNVASHDLIRTFISMHARVKSVRYLDEVFHAVQCQSVVLTLEKTSYSGAVGEVIVNTNDSTYIVRRDRSPLDFNFRITDQEAYEQSMTYAKADIDLSALLGVEKGYVSVASTGNADTKDVCFSDFVIDTVNGVPAALFGTEHE